MNWQSQRNRSYLSTVSNNKTQSQATKTCVRQTTLCTTQSVASLVENLRSCSVFFLHCTKINSLTCSMGQCYFVVTRLHMNRTILRILAEGQSFSTFHHFFPFFDNESFTFPHGLDSLFMWVILCWQMLRVFQSVKLLVSPMESHLIMRTTLHWWLIKSCFFISFCRHMDYLASEATCT